MPTTIEVDDDLIAAAMEATGLPTKNATVEEGLRILLRAAAFERALDDMRGLGWEGDLDEIRGRKRD